MTADDPAFEAISRLRQGALGEQVRRVQGQRALLLSGGRALLLQVAHPKVAEGVMRFSSFRERPLDRLRRTLEFTLPILFGTEAEARASVVALRRLHQRVQGTMTEAVGPFVEGESYDANDPALTWWVQATLVESSVWAFERFVGPLSAADRDAFFRGAVESSVALGVRRGDLPETWEEFRRAFDDVVHGPSLAVGDAGRSIAAAVLRPSLPWGAGHVASLFRGFTVAQLPAPVRAHYGLDAGPVARAMLTVGGAAVRALHRITPRRWQRFACAWQAESRVVSPRSDG